MKNENVVSLPDRLQGIKRMLSGNGEPPDNGVMEARVSKLEDAAQDTRDRLVRVETKVDAVATKAEVNDLKAELVKWIVATAGALGVAGITVMTFVLNNAVPKVPSTPPSQQPIIINVPAPAITSVPATPGTTATKP
jgi:hypothetical protein